MKRVRLIPAGLITAQCSFLASAALAYQCEGSRPFPEELARSSVVFTGRIADIVKVEAVGGTGGPDVLFDVAKVYKGNPGRQVYIMVDSIGGKGYGYCNVYLEVGETYLVYASGKPLRTDISTRGIRICNRTRAVKDASDDLRELEKIIGTTDYEGGAKVMPIDIKLKIQSPAFSANGYIPKKHSCEGKDVSPPLSWSDIPAGTRSLAVIMDDPDAPPGTWVHWVLYNLPADLKGLKEGIPRIEVLSDGAKHGLCWGVQDFSRVGYYGPCPPPGKPHRYFFKLYALDKMLGLEPKAGKDQVLKAMAGHILAQGELVGLYER